ncbi:MAG TPA: SDR family oxidoreductase [Marmoricola sp.]|jgi:NAD(P)-dependent dehydrogenase (short-subunit alcohol dehydrogenase family)|nr:SDR family oxidoreductase [Marmoricola sp.]
MSGEESAELTGLRVLVAGGGSGIGAASAALLAARGAEVTVLDLDVSSVPAGITSIAVDGRDCTAVREAVDAVGAGGLDAVVNAIGIEYVETAAATSGDDWDRVLRTNLSSYHYVTSAALAYLGDGGSVVNVASQLALVGAPRFSAYTASKAGIIGYSRSLALEVAGRGIRVNVVCPGAVDTPLLQRQFADGPGPQGSLDGLVAMHPLGRLGNSVEIAEPIAFLCSARASFMTGSVLVVDGGYTTH